MVSAPASVQASRVLGRADMSEGKFRAIRAAQLSDAEKRRRADFVISTGLSKAQTLRQLTAAVTLLRQGRWRPSRGKAARRRPPFWMHHA